MRRVRGFLLAAVMSVMMAMALTAVPGGVFNGSPVSVTAYAASKKVIKKNGGYYSVKKAVGYWADKQYKTKGLKRIYKFDKNHYMSKSSYNKMVKALKKKSYKALKKAIGKGKRIQKARSCSGGKYDCIYTYGSIWVYTTDDTITLIK